MYVVTKNGIASKESVTDNLIIRDISSKEELEETIERMPYIQTIQAPNNRTRKELYQMAMDKFDDVEWVKVIKSVYLRIQDGHYEDYEKEFMAKAKAFLYGEMAVRFGLSIEKVEVFVIKKVEKHMREF